MGSKPIWRSILAVETGQTREMGAPDDHDGDVYARLAVIEKVEPKESGNILEWPVAEKTVKPGETWYRTLYSLGRRAFL